MKNGTLASALLLAVLLPASVRANDCLDFGVRYTIDPALAAVFDAVMDVPLLPSAPPSPARTAPAPVAVHPFDPSGFPAGPRVDVHRMNEEILHRRPADGHAHAREESPGITLVELLLAARFAVGDDGLHFESMDVNVVVGIPWMPPVQAYGEGAATGFAVPGIIFFNPGFYSRELIAHEMCHQRQYRALGPAVVPLALFATGEIEDYVGDPSMICPRGSATGNFPFARLENGTLRILPGWFGPGIQVGSY